MKKILSILMCLVLLVGLVTGCGAKKEEASTETAPEEQTYNWRFAHEEIDGSVQDVYVKEFAKKLNEKSNGRINIEVYPVGQIGDATQQTELLQNGGIEFAMVSPGNTGTIVPENQLFSLQFLFPDDMEKAHKVLKESKALNEMLAAEYMKKSIMPLSFWTEGAMQWTSSKALNTPSDFEGFKMRTMPSPMIVAAYEAYGANPTPVPYMEVYSGLQLNMIEGQENPLFAIEEMKFCEVQKYLTLANASYYVTCTGTNPEFFNSLPKDIQGMILETVEELSEFGYEVQKKLNGEALDKIKAAGYDIEIVELKKEDVDKFKEASMSAREKYKEMVGQRGAEILEELVSEVEAAK
ncbi:TRAP transporter substrate-binding protein [Anaeromicrobium sediminis]|uniref:C4-dicarboxylate ABC transporter n=1 Tax=Anaeromicrobium sediminis TaxID=1478221 RepID=A0A267MI23_9FIRM|nr:DctP family TRAP transporter solute-binding subunit [Anaeromicrobium sediminis]PAB59234.1 hypothetical protein CCE28_12000 [Anaeromicrobium sediminis]